MSTVPDLFTAQAPLDGINFDLWTLYEGDDTYDPELDDSGLDDFGAGDSLSGSVSPYGERSVSPYRERSVSPYRELLYL